MDIEKIKCNIVPVDQPVEFIVPHMEAMGLKFVCVVKATVDQPELNDERSFLDSLRRAVTRWINETTGAKPPGRKAVRISISAIWETNSRSTKRSSKFWLTKVSIGWN